MGSKIQMSFIQPDIKNMLPAVMVTNWFAIMIHLESFLSHILVNML